MDKRMVSSIEELHTLLSDVVFLEEVFGLRYRVRCNSVFDVVRSYRLHRRVLD